MSRIKPTCSIIYDGKYLIASYMCLHIWTLRSYMKFKVAYFYLQRNDDRVISVVWTTWVDILKIMLKVLKMYPF